MIRKIIEYFLPTKVVAALVSCKCEFRYIIYAKGNGVEPSDFTEVCVDCGKAYFKVMHDEGPYRGSFRDATKEIKYCEKGWLPWKKYYHGQMGPFVPFINGDGTRTTKEDIQKLLEKGNK
jgi:hypothetical protein